MSRKTPIPQGLGDPCRQDSQCEDRTGTGDGEHISKFHRAHEEVIIGVNLDEVRGITCVTLQQVLILLLGSWEQGTAAGAVTEIHEDNIPSSRQIPFFAFHGLLEIPMVILAQYSRLRRNVRRASLIKTIFPVLRPAQALTSVFEFRFIVITLFYLGTRLSLTRAASLRPVLTCS